MYSATLIPPSQFLLVYRWTGQGVQDTHPVGSRIGEYHMYAAKKVDSLPDERQIKEVG